MIKGIPLSNSSRPDQALQVFKRGDEEAELRVTSVDEAASLLWAAQWLDEHREYTVTDVRLEGLHSADDGQAGITTLVIALYLANEPEPSRFGPWVHGVPPITL
jgi:hypothetical protein